MPHKVVIPKESLNTLQIGSGDKIPGKVILVYIQSLKLREISSFILIRKH